VSAVAKLLLSLLDQVRGRIRGRSRRLLLGRGRRLCGRRRRDGEADGCQEGGHQLSVHDPIIAPVRQSATDTAWTFPAIQVTV